METSSCSFARHIELLRTYISIPSVLYCAVKWKALIFILLLDLQCETFAPWEFLFYFNLACHSWVLLIFSNHSISEEWLEGSYSLWKSWSALTVRCFMAMANKLFRAKTFYGGRFLKYNLASLMGLPDVWELILWWSQCLVGFE